MTVPPLRNAGLLAASSSSVMLALIPSSLASSPLAVVTGHDLGVEAARVAGGGGPLVRAERELVLALAGDAVPVGHVLRGLAEADRRVHLLHPRADQAPAEAGIGGLQAPRPGVAAALHDERRAGHRLGAAGDGDVDVAGRDRPGGVADRLHARAAQPVHRGAGDLHGQAGQQHGHPGDVPVVLARLVGGAPVDVVDGVHVEIRAARDEGLEDVGGQVVGTDVGQRPLHLADGRPAGIHDEYRAHADLPLHVGVLFSPR